MGITNCVLLSALTYALSHTSLPLITHHTSLITHHITLTGTLPKPEDGHFTILRGTCDVLMYATESVAYLRMQDLVKWSRFESAKQLLSTSTILAEMVAPAGFGELSTLTGVKRAATVRYVNYSRGIVARMRLGNLLSPDQTGWSGGYRKFLKTTLLLWFSSLCVGPRSHVRTPSHSPTPLDHIDHIDHISHITHHNTTHRCEHPTLSVQVGAVTQMHTRANLMYLIHLKLMGGQIWPHREMGWLT